VHELRLRDRSGLYGVINYLAAIDCDLLTSCLYKEEESDARQKIESQKTDSARWRREENQW